MQLKENYNSSVGKHGIELTKKMESKGINPKFFLSVGRFHNEVGIPIDKLSLLFKQLNTYVIKNDNSIDVNKLTFNEFRDILSGYKQKFGIPNKVYDDDTVSIGRIKCAKDIANFQ